jgi:hypothetical protein
MNKYDVPLKVNSTQTILPVLTEDGRVHGFYPIAETVFDNTQTTYTTSDGVQVPLKAVTVDANPALHNITQYVAAVFPLGLPVNLTPWSSVDLIDPSEGAYSWYSMPTQGWVTHFAKGICIGAIQNNLAPGVVTPVTPTAPTAQGGAMDWRASLNYQALVGDCAFFDFNWMTVFRAKSNNDNAPVRIQVLSNPAVVPPATVPPMKATIIGIPQASGTGVVYDTIRIMKLTDLTPGAYEFNFRVLDTTGLYTDVLFTLTVL